MAKVTISNAEAQIISRAIEVIGSREAVLTWMRTPIRALDFATPQSLMSTNQGRAAIPTVLGRLEGGIF